MKPQLLFTFLLVFAYQRVIVESGDNNGITLDDGDKVTVSTYNYQPPPSM